MRRACVLAMLAALLVGGASWASGAERLTRSAFDDAEAVKWDTAFALDLYGALRGAEGNLFFSPMSIHAALGMTYAGARGETAAEMAGVLHLPREQKRAHAALGTLLKRLNEIGTAKGCQLSIANALWGHSGYAFLDDFLKVVRDNYGAGLRQVDFVGATEAARRTINGWVEKKTRDKIKELLKRGDVDAATRLVLTNAIYFKGDWADQFEKKYTKDAPFTVSGNRKITVPMMHKTADFRYMSAEQFQALEMSYEGDALSMVIFLPRKPDGLERFEKSLTPENLGRWVKSLRKREVAVYLPRFKMTARFEMSRTLSGMGMPLAFGGRADFSGMDGTKGLFISKVIHKAFVDVNEEGTEAAAATAVVMALKGVPEPPPVFRADHPFIFLIRDKTTGSILFLGRLVNPKQ